MSYIPDKPIAIITLLLRRGERWWGRPNNLWFGEIVNWRKHKRLLRDVGQKRRRADPADLT